VARKSRLTLKDSGAAAVEDVARLLMNGIAEPSMTRIPLHHDLRPTSSS
jgi:hypothetical protein